MKQSDHEPKGGGAAPQDESTTAKTGDSVGGQVIGVVSEVSQAPSPEVTIAVLTARIRILRRISSELDDSIEHHRRASAAYIEALRRMRAQPPDTAGADAKEKEGDAEERAAHDIGERVKGKREALEAIE